MSTQPKLWASLSHLEAFLSHSEGSADLLETSWFRGTWGMGRGKANGVGSCPGQGGAGRTGAAHVLQVPSGLCFSEASFPSPKLGTQGDSCPSPGSGLYRFPPPHSGCSSPEAPQTIPASLSLLGQAWGLVQSPDSGFGVRELARGQGPLTTIARAVSLLTDHCSLGLGALRTD